MNRFNTKGIVLSRTDYGEADRILTFLTADRGKVKAIAKGVRKSKSKLAGGIELFSVSELTLIIGRGEINTLISTRMDRHYGNIVKNIERTNTAYEFMKMINRATEDQPEAAYFELLEQSLSSLDDFKIDLELMSLWFKMQLLRIGGHSPNLKTDIEAKKLKPGKKYNFDAEKMAFFVHPQGRYSDTNIKFLRLGFSRNPPKALNRIENVAKLSASAQPLVSSMLQNFIRL